MIPKFCIYAAVPLGPNAVLVDTNYGPLFLDTDDFTEFNFTRDWLIDNIDSQEAYDLLYKIKLHYTNRAIRLYMEGDLS